MKKYKYTLSPRIKGMVEWQLEHYHEDKRKLDINKNDMIPSPVSRMSAAGGSSGASRSTESVAMNIMSSQYIQHIEKSCTAIRRVIDELSAEDLRLVDLVFWRKEFTVEGAGMVIGMSRPCAYRHINRILTDIALEMGYVSK